MNDTSEKMAAMIADRHRQMTPEMRLRIASQMFDTARAIVESSLPAHLSPRERRLALIERLYSDQLPLKAKLAFAAFGLDRSAEASIADDVEEASADSEANRAMDNDEVRRRLGLKA